MTFQLGDRVLETTTTTGTGAITLAGAVPGYRAFSAVATTNGDTFYYTIAGGTEWEVGLGTRTGATTFTRDTVFSSSNAGALVNFSPGAKEVWIDFPATHFAMIMAGRNDNLIVNGGQMIDQRRAGGAATGINNTTTYITDQWYITAAGTVAVTAQQVADAPAGFDKSLLVTVTTLDNAIAATDRLVIRTAIEGGNVAPLGFGAAGALSVSLGFWVKANRTGTYSGALGNEDGTRSYPFNFTINVAGTWEYKTVTIAGDTTGTWNTNNSPGFKFYFTMMAGTNFTGTANTWAAANLNGVTGTINGVAATSDFMNITGVSLIPGSVAVSAAMSPYVMRSWDEELVRCQRLYEKSFNYGTVPVQNAGTFTGEAFFPAITAGATPQRLPTIFFSVRKRSTPSITLYNPAAANAEVRDETANLDCSATASLAWEASLQVNTTGNAGSSAGNRLGVHWVADSSM